MMTETVIPRGGAARIAGLRGSTEGTDAHPAQGGTISQRQSHDSRRRAHRRKTIALLGQSRDVAADRSIDATARVTPRRDRMCTPYGAAVLRDLRQGHLRDRHPCAASAARPRSSTSPSRQGPGAARGPRPCTPRPRASDDRLRFHMIISDVTDATLAEMDALVDEGIPTSICSPPIRRVSSLTTARSVRAMQQTGQDGGLILMHAENGLAIDIVAARTRMPATPILLPRGLPLAGREAEATKPGHPLAEVAACRSTSPPLGAPRTRECSARATEGLPAYPRRARSTCSSPSRTWATASRARSFFCSPRCVRPNHAPEL